MLSVAKWALTVGLPALATVGFSTSAADGSGSGVAEPTPTADVAQPAVPERTRPGERMNESDPTPTPTTPPAIAGQALSVVATEGSVDAVG
jgi:hypothetical protein